jgi:hypothetical protein
MTEEIISDASSQLSMDATKPRSVTLDTNQHSRSNNRRPVSKTRSPQTGLLNVATAGSTTAVTQEKAQILEGLRRSRLQACRISPLAARRIQKRFPAKISDAGTGRFWTWAKELLEGRLGFGGSQRVSCNVDVPWVR